MGGCAELSRRTFPPRPSSVGEARRMIRGGLLHAGRDDLVETAELLVSEIVTNALVHAGTPIVVAFSFPDGVLRVEVSDGSPHAPSPRAYGPSAGTGRGLMLLEDMVADWGVVPAPTGKTVWFQVAPEGERRDGSTPGRGEEQPPREARVAHDTVDVQLLEVPLLLHEAWRQHSESLLREHLLASLNPDVDLPAAGPGPDPIEVHAQASDAIALLAEQIPPSGISDDPVDVMVNATAPLVTASSVELRVPLGSVDHFATLDRTIEAALDLVEAGVFLTPATQPEVQALRAWLCAEVRRQAVGEVATAWSPLDEPPLQVPHMLRWDTDRVSDSTTPVLAADDADRIVAVSGPALDLLGYEQERDLVGSRLICVIPERYRQAHLAGFTMHFLSGRAPLIDRTVVVPALRRDGSEVEVSLTIHRARSDDGRAVFVADLAPV